MDIDMVKGETQFVHLCATPGHVEARKDRCGYFSTQQIRLLLLRSHYSQALVPLLSFSFRRICRKGSLMSPQSNVNLPAPPEQVHTWTWPGL